MPTKLNKAGKQQEYIPAGNGDPSGEYGENNGSGNKNIKLSDGKTKPNIIEDNDKDLTGKSLPKGQEKKEKSSDKKEEETKPNIVDGGFKIELDKSGKPKEETKPKSLIDKIDRVNKSKIPSSMIFDTMGYGEEDMREMVEMVFDNDKFFISDTNGTDCVSAFGSNMMLSERSINGDKPSHYSKGGVLYHELGHCVDAMYKAETKFTGMYSFKLLYASSSVVLSNGKTLGDTLKAENTYNKKNGIFAKMKEEYDNRKKEVFKELGMDLDETNAKLKEYEQSFNEARDKYAKENNLTWETMNKAWDHYYKLRDSNKEYQALKENKMNIEIKADRILDVEFGEISDIRTSMGYESFGMGHSQSYWKDATNKAKEFFAECVSAKGTNPKSWELMKKYYPNSCKAFEELAGKIKKEGINKK